MTSLILQVATRFLLPLLLLFSLFVLFRGHNAPGGGFVGGLVAAAAFALYALAFGVGPARRLFYVNTEVLIGVGLLVALGSGLAGLAAGQPFLTGLWEEITLPRFGRLHVGTPFLFDVGVYFLVVGTTLTVIFSLLEE